MEKTSLERQNDYLFNIKIDELISPDKRQRYCLFFGNRLIQDFATLDEALAHQKTNPLHLLLYIPAVVNQDSADERASGNRFSSPGRSELASRSDSPNWRREEEPSSRN